MVETMFRTSFWAVPAFSRVDPAITSAPTGTHTSRSAMSASSEPATQTMHPVSAPRERADSSAATTKGERPLALTATTASSAPMSAETRRGGAGGRVVLAPFGFAGEERGHLDSERRLALGGVERCEPSGRPCPDVDEAATSLEPRGDVVDECRDRRRRSRDGRGNCCVACVHELDQLGRRAQVESDPAASRASVPSSSKAVMASQCMQTIGDWSIPFW